MTIDDYLDDPAKLALTPEVRAALAHRLETDRRGANMIPAPNPHPFPGWSKAYPGFPFGDMHPATRRLWQIRVIDQMQPGTGHDPINTFLDEMDKHDTAGMTATYRLVEPMPADLLTALNTTPEEKP